MEKMIQNNQSFGYNVSTSFHYTFHTLDITIVHSMKNNENHAARLKLLRESMGFSQRDMAGELGVVHGTIGLWESAQRTIPGPVLILMDLYERELGLRKVMPDHDLGSLESSWFSRSLKISGVATETGARYIWNHLKILFSPKVTSNEIQKRTTEAMALRIADTLGKLKGLPMKLGQMVSYMNFHHPDMASSSFASLQDSCKPLSAASVTEIIVEEFKKTPNQLFKKWNPTPFAAASIGQVHRAELDNGRMVAVKVQYPQIRESIESDLVSLRLVEKMGTPYFKSQESGSWMNEMEERLLGECDYRKEMESQIRFAKIYKNHHQIVIPEVIPEFTSTRVLTSDLVLGIRFADFLKSASQEEKNRAAEAIWDFSFGSLIRHGIFNGDPHPGNYLFADGKVTFLDFGCVQVLRKETLDIWKRSLKCLKKDDMEGLGKITFEMGFVSDPSTFDLKHHYEAVKTWDAPFLTDGPFSFTPEYLAQCWKLSATDNPNLRLVNFPREMMLMHHMHWGVYSILTHLKATINCRERIEPFLS